jgi:hypothetical protein
MFHLDVLDNDQYSTVVELSYDGEVHALSLDFNRFQLELIIGCADPGIAAHLRSELSRDLRFPRSIDLGGFVAFGVRARLGQLQNALKEQFVPLIAQEVWRPASADGSAKSTELE